MNSMRKLFSIFVALVLTVLLFGIVFRPTTSEATGPVVAPMWVDTSLASNGQFVYLCGKQACPTDNALPLSSRSVGVVGWSGAVLTTGSVATAQFTTDGGAPYVGQIVWLANALDDGGAGAGKLTATMPRMSTGTSTSAPPGYPLRQGYDFPRNPVRVAKVVDASGYAASKTSKVEVLSPTFEIDTRFDLSGLRSETIFDAAGAGGFSATKNLSTAYNVAGAGFAEGDTKIITFTVAFNALEQFGVWTNDDAAGNNGWEIVAYHGQISIYLLTGGSFTVLQLPVAGGMRAHAVHRVVATIRNSVLYAVDSDQPMASVAVTTGAASIGTMTHRLGYNATGVSPGVVVNAAQIHDPTMSLQEDQAIAASVCPDHPSDTNRITLPANVTHHGGLVWWWDYNVLSLRALSSYNLGSAAVWSWTDGGVTPVTFNEHYYGPQQLARMFQATGPVAVDANGVPRAAQGAQFTYTSVGGAPDIGLDVVDESWWNSDQVRGGSVFVDGAFVSEAPNGGAPRDQYSGPMGTVRRVWLSGEAGGTSDNDNNPHSVQIWNDVVSDTLDPMTGLGHHGGYIVGVLIAEASTITSPASATKSLLLVGDPVLNGNNVSDGRPAHNGILADARADFPTTGTGVVSTVSRLAGPMSTYAVSGSYLPWAHHLLDVATHEGETQVSIVLMDGGYWEYSSTAGRTPSAFGTDLAARIDAINSVFGAAGGPTYAIFLSTDWRIHWNAIAGANPGGATLSQYTSQVTALSTKPNVHIIDPNGGGAQAGSADNMWPTTAGMTSLKGNIKTALQAVGAQWYVVLPIWLGRRRKSANDNSDEQIVLDRAA